MLIGLYGELFVGSKNGPQLVQTPTSGPCSLSSSSFGLSVNGAYLNNVGTSSTVRRRPQAQLWFRAGGTPAVPVINRATQLVSYRRDICIISVWV